MSKQLDIARKVLEEHEKALAREPESFALKLACDSFRLHVEQLEKQEKEEQ